MRVLLAVLFAIPLAACAATSEITPPGTPPAPSLCNAAPAQQYVGQRVTGQIGMEALRVTGSGSLRWIPPRTPVTRDLRQDRLNIEYDDNSVINAIRCG